MLGYGVQPPIMPGVALAQTAQRQPAASQCAEALYRGDGIFRAGRIKTTVLSKEWTEDQTVNLNETDYESLHLFSKSCQR